MQFFKSLLVGAAALVSVVSAQEDNQLYFTNWSPSVQAGQPTTFTWNAPSDAPVTITLREGPSGNLRDILVVTTEGTGGSYTWTPNPDELFNSGNYAFEIEQEGSDPNYTGQFAIGSANGASPAPETATPSETAAPSTTAESTAESTSVETTAAPTTLSTAASTPAGTTTHASTHTSPSATEPTGPGNSAPPNSAASFKSSAALVLAAVGAFAFLQ